MILNSDLNITFGSHISLKATFCMKSTKKNNRAAVVACSVCAALVPGIIHCFLCGWVFYSSQLQRLAAKIGDHASIREVCLSDFSKPLHLAAACRCFIWNSHLHFKTPFKLHRYLSNPFELQQRPDPGTKHQWTQRVNRTSATVLFHVEREYDNILLWFTAKKKKNNSESQPVSFCTTLKPLKRG